MGDFLSSRLDVKAKINSILAQTTRNRSGVVAITSKPRIAALCAVVATSAFGVYTLLLVVIRQPRGTDSTWVIGPFVADQMQYLAWVGQFAHHLLASSPYAGTGVSHRVFSEPLFEVSGWLTHLGLSPAAAYLVWLPVCLATVISGVWAYTGRLVDEPWGRAAAFGIGLLYSSPVGAFVYFSHVGSHSVVGRGVSTLSGEVSSTVELWGNLPGALAVGLLPWCLLNLESAIDATHRRRTVWGHFGLACAIAASISWLHPYQGEVLSVILAGLLVWRMSRIQRLVIAGTLGASLLPLGYYGLLAYVDHAWRVAQSLNHGPSWSVVALLLVLAPLSLPALFTRRPQLWDMQERAIVIWIVGAVIVSLATSDFPQHALEGVTIPLAILAVRGASQMAVLSRCRGGLLAVLAGVGMIVLIVPGALSDADFMDKQVTGTNQAFYLRPGEIAALRFVANSRLPGQVMTSAYLGPLVPVYSGRDSWVGHPYWQADYATRAEVAALLFSGQLDPKASRALVEKSGVMFLVADCQEAFNLQSVLGNMVAAVDHFGCATVYQERPSAH